MLHTATVKFFGCIVHISFSSPVPSGPPLGITAVSSTPYSILLSWSLPRSIYRNGIITGYTMNVTAASSVIFHSSTTANSYTVGSLSPYTRYNCSVAAKTVNGTGPFSRIVLAWTQEACKSHECCHDLDFFHTFLILPTSSIWPSSHCLKITAQLYHTAPLMATSTEPAPKWSHSRV